MNVLIKFVQGFSICNKKKEEGVKEEELAKIRGEVCSIWTIWMSKNQLNIAV